MPPSPKPSSPKPSRLTEVTRAAADAEQQRIGDRIFATRGEAYAGPSAILLQVPALADKIEDLRAVALKPKTLSNALVQLATLVVARHWNVPYIWSVRERLSLKAGIDAAVIDAIRHRRPPAFTEADQAVVYNYTRALLGPAPVAADLHARAVAALGEKGIVELVAVSGLYTTLALTARAADLAAPDGAAPLPD